MKRRFFLMMTVLVIVTPSQLLVTSIKQNSQTNDQTFYQVSVGSNIDVFTHRGGKGEFAPSGSFSPAEEVILYANVTYNAWPEQGKDVTFEIHNPRGEAQGVLVARTNVSGIATTSFCLPSAEYVEGILGDWKVVSSVSIADMIVADTVEFDVNWNLADVNHDGIVDMMDLYIVSIAFGSTPLDSNWNPHADVNEDGMVELLDFWIIGEKFGKEWIYI